MITFIIENIPKLFFGWLSWRVIPCHRLQSGIEALLTGRHVWLGQKILRGVRIWHATRNWRRRHLGATVHACPRKGDTPNRHIYRKWNCGAPNLISFMHYPNLAMYWWLASKGYCNESISMILTGDGWQASLHLSSLHGVASSGFVCISSISYISLYAWLVVYLPLWNIWKYMKVSWDDYSQ